VKSVDLMIDYIVTNQNSYVFANLFMNNFVDLLNKGVEMKDLLASKIFNFEFDFDNWPATSNNTKSFLRPYNGSIFNLRHEYQNIFPDLVKEEKQKEKKRNLIKAMKGRRGSVFDVAADVGNAIMKVEEDRQFKIRYQCNLLPSMSEKEGLIITAIANSDELGIFFTDAVKDLITYKWHKFAAATHWVGWLFHMLYIVALQSYVALIYLDDD
jgi:hypothetical protein